MVREATNEIQTANDKAASLQTELDQLKVEWTGVLQPAVLFRLTSTKPFET